ncbi:MAG: hypothetical protein ABW217_03855 [Polyangiaceae bacterium]
MTKLDELREFFGVEGAHFTRYSSDSVDQCDATREVLALCAEAERLHAEDVQGTADYMELRDHADGLQRRIAELGSLVETLNRQITMRDTDEQSFQLGQEAAVAVGDELSVHPDSAYARLQAENERLRERNALANAQADLFSDRWKVSEAENAKLRVQVAAHEEALAALHSRLVP